MANTTYQITLAVDGRHTVTMTTDDAADTKAALACGRALYEALLKRYGAPEPTQGVSAEDADAGRAETPMCAVHEVPMVRMEGKRGPFWSCHQRTEDGSFCSYRPKNGAQPNDHDRALHC